MASNVQKSFSPMIVHQNMTPLTPYRQIRAAYTSTTIILYQAYNTDIATAAVEHQKLDASPRFSTSRMTWIKPSWAWMLYRSGYSYKDPGQEHILALTLDREGFLMLLRKSVVMDRYGEQNSEVGEQVERRGKRKKTADVRVQWDPERSVRLEKLGYRSIQIGIPRALVGDLVDRIVKIEDVTNRARELKRVLDESGTLDETELIMMDLVPEEKVLDVDLELRAILRMDV